MVGRLLSLFLISLALTGNAQLAFEAQQFFQSKVHPNFMELGDLDGDLKDDFMIANEEEKFITIMLKATGYTPRNIVVGETNPLRRGITFGDFDEDGKADLAVTDLIANRIAVLLGTGGGEFAVPVYYAVGLSPVDITSSDFDDDGDLDLVTANSEAGTISILSNEGNGTFATSVSKSVQNGPETVEFNDIDGDGIIDIIVVNNLSHSVSVLIGNGSGDFEAPVNYALAENPTELQIADINADAFKDIVVVHDGSSFISILYGTVADVFGEPVVVATGLTCAGGVFSITDINEDTFPDIAVGAKSSQSLNLLLNDGVGSFDATTYYVGGEGYNIYNDVIARDLYDRGHLSLWITNTGSITVVGANNDGTGQFVSHTDLNVCPAPYRIVHNDLNNDGYEDIVTANRYAHFITIYMNDTHGGVGPPVNLSAPSCWSVESADVDDDGFVDIIAGGFQKIRIFYGDATYEYGEPVVYNVLLNEKMAIGDINNDGNLDIATESGVYLGDGNRQFTLSQSYPLGAVPNDVAVCDLNADGKLDWITSDQTGDKIQFRAGNGDGTFAAPVPITVGNGPYGITSGYFDDDLDIDIAVTNRTANTVSIILGGSGVLAQSGSFTACCSPTSVLATDVNGDGETDLLVSNVMFVLGDGTGNFAESVLITSTGPQDAAVFDFDGNGSQDLVVASLVTGGGGGITLHLSSGAGPVKSEQTITFDAIEAKSILGSAEFELTATASSGLTITYSSSDPLVATVEGNVVTIVDIGTTTITASQGGSINFLPASPVSRELVVTREEQIIEFAEIPDKLVGDVFELQVTTTSGLDVELLSDNPIATIDGKTVTLIGSGTVTITASHPGDDYYQPAAPVSRTFDVSKKANVIAFTDPADKTLGFTPFNLEATATSELSVVFSTTSDKITISGATVTGAHAGRATIVANQAGNDIYVAAMPVDQSFCINPPKPVITVDIVSGSAVLTSSNNGGNQWKLAGSDVEGGTTNSLNTAAAGSYTVITTIDDCVSEESEPVDLLITGLAHRETGVKVYPNPAIDFLHVEVASDLDERLEIVITDMLGRVMLTKAGRTNNAEVVDIRDAASGNYLLRMATSGSTVVQRFAKR